jgi:2'-5' RNA ligase
MRTFIAIPLPAECRAMLEQMQQSLRVYKADVRWVAIPSIHLTLKFLGDADPQIIPRMAGALAEASKSERSFEIRLHGLGCFPNIRMPRVVWCGIEGEMEGLVRLHRQVETVCSEFGFAPEDRPFHPHLTLGRVNGKRNLQPLLDYIKMGSDLGSSFQADHLNIYKSDLKPQGAVYTVLETIPLNKENPADPTDHAN